MPVTSSLTDSARTAVEMRTTAWSPVETICDEWERRQDSEPAIVPSVLFDEETVREMNWEAYYGF